jgi:phosphoglycerate dehydrogenase-like enzyme
MLERAGVDVVTPPGAAPWSESVLVSLVGAIDAYIAGVEPVTARMLDAAPRLRIIARRGVGHDAIDVAAATARGIPVTITAGVLADAVADHTMALILAVARKIPVLDRAVKAGHWDRLMGIDLAGKTLGIVGFGAIGRAVARRAAGFGMRLLAHDIAPDHMGAAALSVTLCPLDELLTHSDVVTLHVSLGPDTRGFIGDAALRRMRPTAILINTSRGAVVDEAALGQALREGRLAGAGLDVFHEEPTRNAALVAMEQVVATPHVASSTVETMGRMDRAAVEAVLTALRGERPGHLVNPEVYDRPRSVREK